MEPQVMCPHCGELFGYRALMKSAIAGKIPTHDYQKPCRSVCPGSLQAPRNPQTDRRPLWKDDPEHNPQPRT